MIGSFPLKLQVVQVRSGVMQKKSGYLAVLANVYWMQSNQRGVAGMGHGVGAR